METTGRASAGPVAPSVVSVREATPVPTAISVR